ncbi:MAG: methionine synthase [Planctomycetes bacterium]|jgi:5-methyltetrahydrofolate--homocysteine methyltransferase|nr:homocysteine S-methyltransferase family protein [Phycisphaerae bacterium]NBB95777.1 methionine synthase [Planctomycetota bacterium]
MGVILGALEAKGLLVSDGAWGTMLQAKGMTSDDCPEEWNLSHAEDVQAVASAYAEAGSDIILTNTFGGSLLKLAKMGHGEKVVDYNRAGAANSLAAAGDAIVAGSVGPTGEFIEPLGEMTAAEMEAVFSEQIGAMLDAGLRAICVETMSAIEEAACAVRAAKHLDATVDVITTFTFNASPKGFKTMMGVGPEQVVATMGEAGADVLGSNCGNGIEQMVDIAKAFREHTDMPLLIHANAGVPELIGGKTVFRQSPEDMAARVGELVAAGANIVGGCCGTTPMHISAMKAAIADLENS